MKHCLLLLVGAAFLGVGAPASAQFMWLDVNGDGKCNSADQLTESLTSVDVYVSTDRNGDGSTAYCPSGEALTINSYTFVLSASSDAYGGVTYGQWTDAMGFSIAAGGPSFNTTDFFIGRASADILPPGTYKLGTLAITVRDYPLLSILKHSTIDATSQTSFGSQCPGQDFNNTMRYGENVDGLPPGDWNDVCGTTVISDPPTTSVAETTWGRIKKQYIGQ